MKKAILLYSKTKSGILKKNKFTLQIGNTIKGLASRPGTAALLIIDITNISDLDYTQLKELNTDTGKYNIARLVVLEPSQIKFLIDSEIKFDDFNSWSENMSKLNKNVYMYTDEIEKLSSSLRKLVN